MKQSFDGGTTPPLGPLSRAVGAGDLVFVSGTVGTRADGSLPATVGEQTTQTLHNIADHLAAAGLTLDHVVDVTIYLVRPEDYAEANAAYEPFFQDPRPARATVCAGMVHPEHLVEISAIAHRGAAQ